MGWCSGTDVFDVVCEALLNNVKGKIVTPIMNDVIKGTLKEVIIGLEEMDWDCQQESDFWDNSIIQEVFKELHPDWFKEGW